MNNKITITRTCPFCGTTFSKEFDFDVIQAGYTKYKAGSLLQDAFPTLSPSDREFIKTGICDECWNNM